MRRCRSEKATALAARVLIAGLALTVGGTALFATEREGCPAPEARAFDFWIGEWDVVNRGLQSDGSWRETGRASARVVPVLGGCAIVEHWRGIAWDRKTIGFSVRAFDPTKRAWTLVLNWPGGGRPSFGELEGTFRHGRGELFFEGRGPDGEPQPNRYTFSDIAPDRLRWDAARSDDGGATWLTHWIMEFTRRAPEAPRLDHGPWIADGRERACAAEEVAALDFLAGSWRGVETVHGPGGAERERPVRLEVVPILEGCAQMDREWSEAGEERFAVRSWAAVRERWVEYGLRAGEPGFTRAVGTAGEERAELGIESPGSDAEATRRIVWERTGAGIVRHEEVLEGGTWRPERTLRLEPTFYGAP